VQASLDILFQIGSELWISRQVLREYAMTVTRPQSFVTSVTHREAAKLVRQLSALFRVADETQAVSTQWIELLDMVPMGGRQVHDANIAATMIVYRIPALLTLNTVDFVRFEPKIKVLTLADVEAMKPVDNSSTQPPL
jgi:predicted nucleic acid-binding protein